MNPQTLMDAVNQDPELSRRGKYYSIRFGLEMDDRQIHFKVENGKLISATENAAEPATFILKGTADTWRRFIQKIPPPGYHDVAAMLDQGHLDLEGDPMPWLTNMLFIKGIINHWKAAHDSH